MADYTNIDRPYDAVANRIAGGTSPVFSEISDLFNQPIEASSWNDPTATGASTTADANYVGIQTTQTLAGPVETQQVNTNQSLPDLTITTFIRSKNFKPGAMGFNISGQTGNAEFNNVLIRGVIYATTGSIGGWLISGGNIVGPSTGDAAIMAGMTDYFTGTGFWLGIASGTAKFSIGTSIGGSPAYMTWDGSSLNASNLVIRDSSNNTVTTLGAGGTGVINVVPSSVLSNGVTVVSSIASVGYTYSQSANVNNRAISISDNSTSNVLPAVDITYKGIASALNVTLSGGSSSIGLKITTVSASTNGIYIDNSAGAGTAMNIFTAAGTGLSITSTGAGNSLTIQGGSPSTGVVNITATNDGDAILLTQAANSTNVAIGMHLNVTNSHDSTLAAAFRVDGDAFVAKGTAGTQDRVIRVVVDATVYYIPCYTSHAP